MIGFIFFFFFQKKKDELRYSTEKGLWNENGHCFLFLFSKGRILIFLINKFNLKAVIEMITKPHNNFNFIIR